MKRHVEASAAWWDPPTADQAAWCGAPYAPDAAATRCRVCATMAARHDRLGGPAAVLLARLRYAAAEREMPTLRALVELAEIHRDEFLDLLARERAVEAFNQLGGA